MVTFSGDEKAFIRETLESFGDIRASHSGRCLIAPIARDIRFFQQDFNAWSGSGLGPYDAGGFAWMPWGDGWSGTR